MSHGEFICARAAGESRACAAARRRLHDVSAPRQRQTSSLRGAGSKARFGCGEDHAMMERTVRAGRRVKDGRAPARPAVASKGGRLLFQLSVGRPEKATGNEEIRRLLREARAGK